MATAKKNAAKKAPEPEVEELEELEEMDADEVEEAPAKKAADEVEFGVGDIAKIIEKKTGKVVSNRELRTLIRKMARDGSGRVDREIVPGNRTRYSWSGPNDPEVKAIVKAFEGGELEADKQEKLAALKAQKAEKTAAKKAAAEKAEKAAAKTKKAAAAPAEDDEEVDDEELELDED
jgi:hypothetical protein